MELVGTFRWMIEVDTSRCGRTTKIMLEVCETTINRVCFKVNRSVEVVHGGLVVRVERWATVITFVWGRCRTGAFVWGRLAVRETGALVWGRLAVSRGSGLYGVRWGRR